MGSPKFGLLSEIFLQDMEETHFENLNLKYNIMIISRYVDDMPIIYNDVKQRRCYNTETQLTSQKKKSNLLKNGSRH
jgi:hypothetical protein